MQQELSEILNLSGVPEQGKALVLEKLETNLAAIILETVVTHASREQIARLLAVRDKDSARFREELFQTAALIPGLSLPIEEAVENELVLVASVLQNTHQ